MACRPRALLNIPEHAARFGGRIGVVQRAMHMPPRRSRMRRTRTGKRIELTARDLEIFKLLGQYRYLRSTYIHAFVGGTSETRFKERIGDLFHEGYLDRPVEQWKFASGRYQPVVHELGTGARRVLSEIGAEITDQRTWLRNGLHRQFEHSLMVCEVLASIELGMRKRPNLRFVSWPEIRAKAPRPTKEAAAFPMVLLAAIAPDGAQFALVPDALFGIEYTNGDLKLYRFFALEADRGTMPVVRASSKHTSIFAKIAVYRETIAQQRHKTCLGVPNLVVLLVTLSQQRADNILAALQTEPGPNSNVLVRSVSATGDLSRALPSFLTEPWARAGHAPLRIDDPS